MIEHRPRRHDPSLDGCEPSDSAENGRFSMRADEEILHSLSAGMPLPYLLNRICSVLDCEIGDVVSLICIVGQETKDFAIIAENAKQFGLHRFYSVEIFAENRKLLGTLETYSCQPAHPSPGEVGLMEHAASLAAIAIEGRTHISKDAASGVAEMRLSGNRVLDWPGTLN